MARPSAEVVARVEAMLAVTTEIWGPVESRGYALGERWRVEVPRGRSVFVKVGATPSVADNLRAEHVVYDQIEAPFLPQLVAWEGRDPPLLVLEDLSDARWPPPWLRGDVETVLATIDRLAESEPPQGIPRLEDAFDPGWAEVAEAPEPFLRLSVASEAWLGDGLSTLLAAERGTPMRGDTLVHCDLRSDNLCLRDDGALFVDWNLASVGNPDFDVAFWLPSLVLERGASIAELPERRPSIGDFAAFVAGFFACRAGLEPPVAAPTVRGFQLAQLRVALSWAARALGLPPPDGRPADG